ncbi:oligosaccharide flippase family protein [Croceivirga thetidis]|uniref:Oligosaccharide flippase family protein n=1 Tax=Croceivirga thetidis TaxID=2721623 RepID=A0ABX1GLH9_9FLAO|nr:oligosaccharide flippase family protein [Croceivirga thetidis]NKI30714.1 oligosaccharide flippase family protein [Croceivirga thetidis]
METLRVLQKRLSPEQVFMLSVIVVNGGNYLYNLLLGRILGPEAFAEAALLITLLLVLSFLGMTFQLTAAKFAVIFSGEKWQAFKNNTLRLSLLFGISVGILMLVFSKQLQQIFHTESNLMFVVFAFGVPLYFFMSLNRGIYQGRQEFKSLSVTYQTEMWSRLLITLAILFILPWQPGVLVAIGILVSFFFGLYPSEIKSLKIDKTLKLEKYDQNRMVKFMVLTACYELTQIIINNSDILLVKHFFEAKPAGLYASLALIGRVVYFAAWMFVMLLLPTVVKNHKEGKPTAPVLFKYVAYIGALALMIVAVCYLFPDFVVNIMFGSEYLEVSHLLWKYALATSLFALSNIFAYYFLSLDQYVPVILSGLLGMSQIGLIVLYHDSLNTVIIMQIMAMSILLLVQILYFLKKEVLKTKISNQ